MLGCTTKHKLYSNLLSGKMSFSDDYGTVIRQPEPPKKPNKHWFGARVVVSQFFTVFVALLIFIWCATEGSLSDFPSFNYHPLFAVLGLVVLGGESLLCYRTFRKPARKNLKYAHMVLFVLAFCMMCISLHCVYRETSSHFAGPHQWMGLTTAVLFSWQFVQGFLWRFWPGAPSSLVSWYHNAHSFFGVVIFLCSCTTAMMGMAIDADSTSGLGKFVENLFPLAVVAMACSVVYFLISPKFRRKDFPTFDPEGEHLPILQSSLEKSADDGPEYGKIASTKSFGGMDEFYNPS